MKRRIHTIHLVNPVEGEYTTIIEKDLEAKYPREVYQETEFGVYLHHTSMPPHSSFIPWVNITHVTFSVREA